MNTFAQANLQEPQPAGGRLRRRLLLIEPDGAPASGLESHLRAAGCQVEAARGSFEYLPRIAVAASKFDILVFGWDPDEVTGPALSAELRKLREDPARPLLLSFGSGATMPELMDVQLREPFSAAGFRRVVESWEIATSFRNSAGSPALDRDAVADLASLDGGVLLHDLTAVCLRSTQEYVERARGAVQRGDTRGLREAVHVLKGSSGVFGASRLVGLCEALEEMGRAGSLEGAGFLLDRLEAESRNFDQELRVISEATAEDNRGQTPNNEGIDLSQMAGTFQGKRIVAQGLPPRIAQRLEALLFAMDARFRVLPERMPGGDWQLTADLLILTGDQGEEFWEQARRLRRQMPRAGMVLLLDEPTLSSLDRTEELGAEVVGCQPELRDLLLRSFQQLQIRRRPRAAVIETPPPEIREAAAEARAARIPGPAVSGLGSLATSVRAHGPLRALVAEDESLTARFLVSVLEANGFVADHADNGNRAVSMLSVRTYDTVLLDLNMPELDGYGVLARLRQMPQYQDTPVLVLSARNQERDILRAFSLGASDYVTKPFSPPEVVFRLKRMVERS